MFLVDRRNSSRRYFKMKKGYKKKLNFAFFFLFFSVYVYFLHYGFLSIKIKDRRENETNMKNYNINENAHSNICNHVCKYKNNYIQIDKKVCYDTYKRVWGSAVNVEQYPDRVQYDDYAGGGKDVEFFCTNNKTKNKKVTEKYDNIRDKKSITCTIYSKYTTHSKNRCYRNLMQKKNGRKTPLLYTYANHKEYRTCTHNRHLYIRNVFSIQKEEKRKENDENLGFVKILKKKQDDAKLKKDDAFYLFGGFSPSFITPYLFPSLYSYSSFNSSSFSFDIYLFFSSVSSLFLSYFNVVFAFFSSFSFSSYTGTSSSFISSLYPLLGLDYIFSSSSPLFGCIKTFPLPILFAYSYEIMNDGVCDGIYVNNQKIKTAEEKQQTKKGEVRRLAIPLELKLETELSNYNPSIFPSSSSSVYFPSSTSSSVFSPFSPFSPDEARQIRKNSAVAQRYSDFRSTAFMGMGSVPPLPRYEDKGNLTSWMIWWHTQMGKTCYQPSELDWNRKSYKDFQSDYSRAAFQMLADAGNSRSDSVSRYMQEDISLSGFMLGYSWPFLILSLFGLILLLVSCCSCIAFYKPFRKAVSKRTCGVCCRDRRRSHFSHIKKHDKILIYTFFGLFGVGGLLALIINNGVHVHLLKENWALLQCSLWRMSYELMYGDLYTGKNENKLRFTYDNWAKAVEEDYQLNTLHAWMGINNALTLCSDLLDEFYTEGGKLQSDLLALNAAYNAAIAKENEEDEDSEVSHAEMDSFERLLKTTKQISKRYFHSSYFSDHAKNVRYSGPLSHSSAIERRLNEFVGPNSTLLNETYSALYNVSESLREGGDFVGSRMMDWQMYSSEADANKNTFFDFIITFPILALIGTFTLSCILISLVLSSKNDRSIWGGLLTFAACSWIYYFAFAAIALILGGLLLSLASFAGESCNFTKNELLQKGNYKKYYRFHEYGFSPYGIRILTHCFTEGKDGNILSALGKLETLKKFKVETSRINQQMEQEFGGRGQGNTLKRRRLLEAADDTAECVNTSWIYHLNTNEILANGLRSKIDDVYEEILQSGIQPFDEKTQVDFHNLINTKNVKNNKHKNILFGLKTIIEKIKNEAAIYTNETQDWCMIHQPKEMGECDISSPTAIHSDSKAELHDMDPAIKETYNKIAKQNEKDGRIWLNSIWWIVQKEKLLSSNEFLCKSGEENRYCDLQTFSPQLSSSSPLFSLPRRPPPSFICDALSAAEKEAEAASSRKISAKTRNAAGIIFQDRFAARTRRMESKINKLVDGTHCSPGWQNFDVLVHNSCNHFAASFMPIVLGIFLIALCCLLACCPAFKVWHFLMDVSREMERESMMMQHRNAQRSGIFQHNNEEIQDDAYEDAFGEDGEDGEEEEEIEEEEDALEENRNEHEEETEQEEKDTYTLHNQPPKAAFSRNADSKPFGSFDEDTKTSRMALGDEEYEEDDSDNDLHSNFAAIGGEGREAAAGEGAGFSRSFTGPLEEENNEELRNIGASHNSSERQKSKMQTKKSVQFSGEDVTKLSSRKSSKKNSFF